MELGKKIKELRKQSGITQEQLAKICGVASGTVSMWEIDRAFPRIVPLEKMCKYFNVTKSYFLEDAPLELTYKENQIVMLYRELSTQGQEALDIFLQGLLANPNYKR